MKTFFVKINANSNEKDGELVSWREGKRCLLRVDDESFSIGKERLPFCDVASAKLIVFPSALFISNMVLTLHMKSGIIHHMKSTDDPFGRRTFPFPLTIQTGYVPFLWIRRVAMILMSGWLLWVLFLL